MPVFATQVNTRDYWSEEPVHIPSDQDRVFNAMLRRPRGAGRNPVCVVAKANRTANDWMNAVRKRFLRAGHDCKVRTAGEITLSQMRTSGRSTT